MARSRSHGELTNPAGLLLDLDGVCYVGDEPIEGAADTLRRIDRAGLPLRMVTNTTELSFAEVCAKIERLGLSIDSEKILTSPQAALRWLKSQGPPRCRLVVGDHLLDELSELPRDDDAPEVILLGDRGDEWNHRMLEEIFRQMMDGARLVALHKGRYWQVSDGLALDIGLYVSGLEYVTGQTARIMGKPSCDFFGQAVAELGLDIERDAARVVMVGDDVLSDVGGAQNCGLNGVLVRTGKYREEAVARSGVEPDAIVDSIADVPGLLGLD